ncbi:MAG: hypothetical protein AB9869_30450 [Verrucomicrobiia bacterium]
METCFIDERQQKEAQRRNQAFWKGELEEGPLMWVTAPGARPCAPVPEPAGEEELWTNVDYVIAATDSALRGTHYAGDALPVFCPWLGPDQFAGWLGADLVLQPREFTSWSKPFVQDWAEHSVLQIKPDNRWWQIYLQTVRESVRSGQGKWVTGYPDLHTGLDALSAIRGATELASDLLTQPDAIRRAMRQLTDLWKFVVDTVSEIVVPAGQGTSNWTMGWSSDRYLCIGQNDYSCMISERMFEEFCWEDNLECCAHVDRSLYHLDGPAAVRHLPVLLRLERLNCIQWIQGASQPLPSQWLPLLKRIQAAGKSVQLYYGNGHGGDADLKREIDILATALDPARLFIWATVKTAELADAVVQYSHEVFSKATRQGHPGNQSRCQRDG